jgi:formamidopyrimidine-DNA glycosylase
MHLGMTGWVKFSTEETGYYRQAKEKMKEDVWPPLYVKWLIKCEAEGDREAVEVAFVDPRRLARIRLVECEAEDIRKVSPLKENGPDPYIDKDIVTTEWLTALMRRKKVPVKGLLLDQGNISGVGNWVADEILYQARLHPEQYSNTFSDEEIARLRESLLDVTGIACSTLADSTQFPENWLMKHRWDKGKKASNVLPNGEKIVHLTVSGRTSAIVPSVQKKTGNVAGDVKAEALESDDEDTKKPAKGRKRKAKVEKDEEEDEEEEVMPAKKQRGKKAVSETNGDSEPKKPAKGKKAKAEPVDDKSVGGDEEEKPSKAMKAKATPTKAEKSAIPGERKSARTKAK